MKTLLIIACFLVAGCADVQKYADSVDFNASGDYNQNTGDSGVRVGGTIHFRELPNYSKDK